MRISGCFFTSILLCCNAVLAGFSGSDNFNDNVMDTSKWSVYSGLLSETNNRLEYVTSESEAEAGIWLWILNTGSYAQDWTVSMDAHNSISPSGSEEYAEVCLTVVNSADYDDFFDIDLEIKGSTPYLIESGWGTNEVDGIWVDVSIGNTNDASLKIAFDSITKTLVSSYDVGNGYATLNSVNVSDWGIDGFRIAILCESEGIIVPSGQIYADNLEAVTFPYNAVITNCYPVASGFTLERIPLAGLNSVVKWSTNLVNTPFADLSPALPYPQNSYTDTVHGAEDECFYQVEVLE